VTLSLLYFLQLQKGQSADFPSFSSISDLVFNPDNPRLYRSQDERTYHNALFRLSKTLETYVDQNLNSKIGNKDLINSDTIERYLDEESKDLYARRYLEFVNKAKCR
jgi:hypothetical protein